MLLQIAAVVGIALGATELYSWYRNRTTYLLDSNLPAALAKQVVDALNNENDPVKLDALATQLAAYPLAAKLLRAKAAKIRTAQHKANPPPAPPKNVIYNPPAPPSPTPAPIVEPAQGDAQAPHIDPPVYVPPAPAALPPSLPNYGGGGAVPTDRGAIDEGGGDAVHD